MATFDPILSALEAEIDRIKNSLGNVSGSSVPLLPSVRWEIQVAAYEAASTKSFEALRISALGGTSDAEQAFTLSGLYVDPAAETAVFEQKFGNVREEKHGGSSRRGTIERTTRPSESILTILRTSEQQRHIVLGPAGSGKSSVLRYLYLEWARQKAASETEAPIPILIEVREYLGARDRAIKGEDHQPVADILDYLTQKCGRNWHFDRTTLLAQLDSGKAMLLVDGIDEAFDPDVRQRLCQWLRDFSIQHPSARIIASSRVIGFTEHEWPREGTGDSRPTWAIHTLCPFDKPRIATFLDRWFATQFVGERSRANMREEVANAIRDRAFLQPLAEFPLTLTMVCAVGQRGIRPDSRNGVFFEAAKIFIQQWDNARGLPKDQAEIVGQWRNYGETGRLEFFRTVALRMVGSGNPNDSNRISRDDLRDVLLAKFEAANDPNPSALADGILNLLCERNFLLTELGGDAYAFFHRAFLEYFTALGWAKRFANFGFKDKDGNKTQVRVFFEQIILPRWHDPTWHDTLRFLFGLLEADPAADCLAALAGIKEEELPKGKVVGDIERDELPQAALVLAAELAQEVQPYTSDDGQRITPQSIAAGWKDGLVEFARTDTHPLLGGTALRRRALMAVAALWRGDVETGWQLARLLLKDTEWWAHDWHLGQALADILPGKSEFYWLLLDIVLAPARAQLAQWEGRYDTALCPEGAPKPPSFTSSVEHAEGNPCRGSGRYHTAPPMTPPAILAPFLQAPNAYRVRGAAMRAVASGWPGDAQAKAALLLVLQGDPALGIPRDEHEDVRWSAVSALADGWPDDAQAKAAVAKVAADKTEPDGVRKSARHALPQFTI